MHVKQSCRRLRLCVCVQFMQPDPSKKALYDAAFERHQSLSNALFQKRP